MARQSTVSSAPVPEGVGVWELSLDSVVKPVEIPLNPKIDNDRSEWPDTDIGEVQRDLGTQTRDPVFENPTNFSNYRKRRGKRRFRRRA